MRNSFFFETRTRRVMTWRARLIVLLIVPIVAWVFWPAARWAVTRYVYAVDTLLSTSHLIVENWDTSMEMFEDAANISKLAGANELCSTIYEDAYVDGRKRHAYVLNAWAAGIDTIALKLIPVPRIDPKTFNIAKAVVDSAHKWGWDAITVVTPDLHSARSGKAYRRAAKPYKINVRVLGVPYEGITWGNWYTTSSGLAMAFSEMIKKLYYDIIVF